jgi:hypothetical protein
MSRVGFEPKIPAFDRAKIVHAFDRAATVIGEQLTECGRDKIFEHVSSCNGIVAVS